MIVAKTTYGEAVHAREEAKEAVETAEQALEIAKERYNEARKAQWRLEGGMGWLKAYLRGTGILLGNVFAYGIWIVPFFILASSGLPEEIISLTTLISLISLIVVVLIVWFVIALAGFTIVEVTGLVKRAIHAPTDKSRARLMRKIFKPSNSQ